MWQLLWYEGMRRPRGGADLRWLEHRRADDAESKAEGGSERSDGEHLMCKRHLRRLRFWHGFAVWLACGLTSAVLVTGSGAASAGESIFMTRTNGDLLKYCRSTVEAFHAVKNGRDVVPNNVNGTWNLATAIAGCQGFLEGFRDAMDVATRSNTSVGAFNLVCLPETVTTADLASAYVRWGEANGKKGDESASMGVYRAWRETWPCAKTVMQ